jgi:16S rRNA (uracil1498-N3)-methyltransferase
MIRLFVPDDLAAESPVTLSTAQAHYLRDVMRRAAGDEVALFNGRDGEWLGAIASIERKAAGVIPMRRAREQIPTADLELVVALVKRARLETIVEKATELGARRIRLALTRFTQAERTNVGRLTAIAVEAAEQTGRLDVPEIVAPAKLEAILAGWPAQRALIFCDEAGDAAPILAALNALLLPSREKVARVSETDEGPRERLPRRRGADAESSARPLIRPGIRPATFSLGGRRAPSAEAGATSILIGPEGGFSTEERASIRNLPPVIPVSLGPRILRVDTAAIAALSLWQAALGDWRP